MDLDIDLNDVEVIEFGVGREVGDGLLFSIIRVDEEVQETLLEMIRDTWTAMCCHTDDEREYEPSESHASTEYLRLPNDSVFVGRVSALHGANNLTIDSNALGDPDVVVCYFVRLVDRHGKRITGVRRASYFKGLLQKQKWMVRLLDDTLGVVPDTIFKLDKDFDLIIDSGGFHIWRPNNFEFLAALQQEVLAGVPRNVDELHRAVPYLDVEVIERYAADRPRAARLLASIRNQNLQGIDREVLEGFCRRHDVAVCENGGRLTVSEKDVMDLLEILDRRRYIDELDPHRPEAYRAASRRRVGG